MKLMKKLRGIQMNEYYKPGMQYKIKYILDFILALIGLIITSPILLFSFIIASIETKESGFFTQKRVGKKGKIFKVIKIKSMKTDKNLETNVTTQKDPRITFSGKIFNAYCSKQSELH